MITVTSKSFKDQLGRWKTSATTVRDNLQALLLFAMDQAGAHNNYDTIGQVVAAVQSTKTVDTKGVIAYVSAHLPVKFKIDDTITASKDKGKDAVSYRVPQVTWYEFSKPDQVTEITLAKMLKAIEKFATVEPEDGKRTVEAGVNSLAADVLEFIRTKQAA